MIDSALQKSVGLIIDRAEMTIHCSPDPSETLLDIGIGL
jgi:hypothetical protein